MRERVTIGFGFSSDWLRKWREIFRPITKHSNAKPKQTQFTFDTQVKTALSDLQYFEYCSFAQLAELIPSPQLENGRLTEINNPFTI